MQFDALFWFGVILWLFDTVIVFMVSIPRLHNRQTDVPDKLVDIYTFCPARLSCLMFGIWVIKQILGVDL